MTWLNILVLLFKYGPAVFTLIKEIVALIGQLQSSQDQEEAKNEFFAAANHYKASKDKEPLYGLLQKLKKHAEAK